MTAGTGHRRAAEALAEAAARRFPAATVHCVDLLAYTPAWLRWFYPRLYEWVVRCAPLGWALAFSLTDTAWVLRLLQPGRRVWNRLMARRFLRWVEAAQPDVVIATHFFPADVFRTARRQGRLRARIVVVVTDLFAHRLWTKSEADAVVVGSDQTSRMCQARGIAASCLHVLGIPVGGRFAHVPDRALARRSLGLDPSRRVVLIAGGGMGVGPYLELARRFAAQEAKRPGQIQLAIVCGHNQRLRGPLEHVRQTTAMPIHVLGFVDTMPELMAASDVLVTKAGGMTVTEALAVGLPMIFCDVIPGHERFNADDVVRQGAGIMSHNAAEAVTQALGLFEEPERLGAMRDRALAIGHPNAADEIIRQCVIGGHHV